MNKDRIKHTANKYHQQGLWIVAGMSLISLLVMRVMDNLSMLNGLIVCALFSILSIIAYGASWRYVAKVSSKSLSLFYLAGSGIRMLLGGVVVIAYYIISSDYASFRNFALLFVSFYLVLLAFDVWFFARFEKGNLKVLSNK